MSSLLVTASQVQCETNGTLRETPIPICCKNSSRQNQQSPFRVAHRQTNSKHRNSLHYPALPCTTLHYTALRGNTPRHYAAPRCTARLCALHGCTLLQYAAARLEPCLWALGTPVVWGERAAIGGGSLRRQRPRSLPSPAESAHLLLSLPSLPPRPPLTKPTLGLA